MDIKKIKALAELLDKYSLTEIDYTEADNKIKIKREPRNEPIPIKEKTIQVSDNNDMPVVNEPPVMNTSVYSFGDVSEIITPLVGVFYSAPAPDAKPYVDIGTKVKKGDVLCIVEAMKLMNEITADFDGEVVDICAENGQIVEYGQTLFKLIR